MTKSRITSSGKHPRVLASTLLLAVLLMGISSTASAVADPMLDTSFGTGGIVATDFSGHNIDQASAAAIQSNGKIVVVGTATASGSDFGLARYNTDGSLDSSFGTGGTVTTHFANNEFGNAVAIQPDGKIVVVGQVPSSDLLHYDFGVVRYNTDGSLDSGFGTGGKVRTDIGTSSGDEATAVAIQPDGEIVVAGSTNSGGSNNFAVVRYDAVGSLDASFGTSGKVITDVGSSSDDSVRSMALQTDGKIVVAGSSNKWGSYDFAIARYTSTGGPDNSFGVGGKITTDIGTNTADGAYSIAVQPDGKLVAAGYTIPVTSGPWDYAFVRYSSGGTTDSTFGTSGKVTVDIGTNSDDQADAMVLQPDGKIVAAGYTDTSGSYDFSVIRLTTVGLLDTTFGTTGKVTTDIGAATNDQANAVAIQSDGKVVAAGFSSATGKYDFTVVRYNPSSATPTTTADPTTTVAPATTTTVSPTTTAVLPTTTTTAAVMKGAAAPTSTNPGSAVLSALPAGRILGSSTTSAGSSIRVTATGFTPGETIGVYITGRTKALATLVANSSGRASATITIPRNLSGAQSVSLYGYTSKSGKREEIAISSGSRLPVTGTDLSVFALVASLLTGTGLLVAVRRKLVG